MASQPAQPSSKPTDKAAAKSKLVADVADSWEDEDVSEPEEDVAASASSPAPALAAPKAPPPTPISPVTYGDAAWPPSGDSSFASQPSSLAAADALRRPEKTDAVARRMIAAGLGLKAPKQTEEQKAYQKAIREQEKKRREQERAEEERRIAEVTKAKAAVWED